MDHNCTRDKFDTIAIRDQLGDIVHINLDAISRVKIVPYVEEFSQHNSFYPPEGTIQFVPWFNPQQHHYIATVYDEGIWNHVVLSRKFVTDKCNKLAVNNNQIIGIIVKGLPSDNARYYIEYLHTGGSYNSYVVGTVTMVRTEISLRTYHSIISRRSFNAAVDLLSHKGIVVAENGSG